YAHYGRNSKQLKFGRYTGGYGYFTGYWSLPNFPPTDIVFFQWGRILFLQLYLRYIDSNWNWFHVAQ
ncbi:uncharacterized protein METZ01_LOCUS342254, partial [marine metagenome]